MMRKHYVVPGRPVPYDRAVDATTSGGKRIRVHSARYRNWRTQAARDLAMQGKAPDGPLAVFIAVMPAGMEAWVTPAGEDPRPSSITVTNAERVTVRGDVDNYAKAMLDAMQSGHVFADDRVVVHLEVVLHAAR